jgi:hypothetical protein
VPPELWQPPFGVRSLLQAPIGSPDAPLGALLLGDAGEAAFVGKDWMVELHVGAAGLQPLVRQAQVEAMAQLLLDLEAAQDPVDMISVLLRVSGWASA